MKAVQILMEEHQNILRMLKVIRTLSLHIFNTKEVYNEGFYQIIDFIKNYADKFHHGKEEDILFEKMSTELGPAIKNGPIFGMLSEHDLGRLFVNNLQEALKNLENGEEEAKMDIIVNAIAYADLLERHIFKEDTAIFTFAEKQLKNETHEEINKLFHETEITLDAIYTEKKYIGILEELEEYCKTL